MEGCLTNTNKYVKYETNFQERGVIQEDEGNAEDCCNTGRALLADSYFTSSLSPL